MLYSIFRLIGLITGYPIQLLLFKRKTFYEGKKNKHTFTGGKLIISNHFNILDYVMTSFIVFPKKLCAVSCEYPFRSRIATFGMKFFGTIKADRTTKSMRFMDEGANIIKNGQLLIIYPEGRNTPDGKMHEFFHSYLVIAYRAGCPIVPMITDGRYGLFKRASVIIGEEIDVSRFFTPDKRTPSREELSAANEYVYSKMLYLQELLEQKKNEGKRKK